MINETITDWEDFKAVLNSKELDRECHGTANKYHIYGFSKRFEFEITLKKGTDEATDFEANYLHTFNKKPIELESSPFSSSETKEGVLVRRDHGVLSPNTPAGISDINLVIPYDLCKISEIEIIGAETGDTATFKVLSSTNELIYQFGFDVGIGKDSWSRASKYAANIAKDVKLSVGFNNRGTVGKKVIVNFNLHEVI